MCATSSARVRPKQKGRRYGVESRPRTHTAASSVMALSVLAVVGLTTFGCPLASPSQSSMSSLPPVMDRVIAHHLDQPNHARVILPLQIHREHREHFKGRRADRALPAGQPAAGAVAL